MQAMRDVVWTLKRAAWHCTNFNFNSDKRTGCQPLSLGMPCMHVYTDFTAKEVRSTELDTLVGKLSFLAFLFLGAQAALASIRGDMLLARKSWPKGSFTVTPRSSGPYFEASLCSSAQTTPRR